MHAEANAPAVAGRHDEIDLLRAVEYALLARLLARAPDAATLAELGSLVGDATPLGQAHAALAAAARRANTKSVEREFFTLFIGVGRGELLPYASYYRTGFLNERPLAALRGDLVRLGIARADGVHDPEDNIAILCDVMRALAAGEVASAAVTERAFFQRHLEPWAERFFDDLATAPSAEFYRSVGRLGATFVGIEATAFALEE
jgi:TorA maturation chaperone TorD